MVKHLQSVADTLSATVFFEFLNLYKMGYTKTDLFGRHESRGTFDDFFDTKKYSSIQDAYKENDYVQSDYVRDDDGALYIEAHHVKNPEVKKYHKLNFQRPVAGIDILDDNLAAEMSASLL